MVIKENINILLQLLIFFKNYVDINKLSILTSFKMNLSISDNCT